jgi:membrane-associated phospholipid phosphatase
MQNIVQIVTTAGESTWYFLILVPGWILFLFIRKNKLLSMRFFYLFLALSASGLINMLIKWLAGRHRPISLFKEGLYGFNYFGLGYELNSFPSGHAVTAFSLATAMTILFPRWGGLLFIPALMIAATRVMLTAHFLSDVVVGACIGIISAMLVKYCFDRKNVELK